MTKPRMATTASRSKPARPEQNASDASLTKTQRLLQLLARPKGASIEALAGEVGWQTHSIRGFLAGKIPKLGFQVTSEPNSKGIRLYRIVQDQSAKP